MINKRRWDESELIFIKKKNVLKMPKMDATPHPFEIFVQHHLVKNTIKLAIKPTRNNGSNINYEIKRLK